MTIEKAFKVLEKNGFMEENSAGIQLAKLPRLKGFPEGVDLENWEIEKNICITRDDEKEQSVTFGIWAGGDWQEMTYMNIVVPENKKPYIVPFDSFETVTRGDVMAVKEFEKKKKDYLKKKKKSESLKESEYDYDPEFELQDDWAFIAEKFFPEDDYIADILPTFRDDLFDKKHWMGLTNSNGEVAFDWRYTGLDDFDKLSTLIHEMIHVKVLFETGELKPNGKAHGPEFIKIMNELNAKSRGKFKVVKEKKKKRTLIDYIHKGV